MWQGYWSKEIIFLILVIFTSRIDSTDARIPRNIKSTEMWIATPAHMLRDGDVPPENINSSETYVYENPITLLDLGIVEDVYLLHSLIQTILREKPCPAVGEYLYDFMTICYISTKNIKVGDVDNQTEPNHYVVFQPDYEKPKHENTDENVLTICFAIATTYMGALRDLRRYYSLKYFYANNLHYEVGYMTSEIIHKYQRMLEIYYIAQTYYFENQNQNLAPPTYMLYLYTNVLEMGTVIAHQCNMLEELEDKFKIVPDTGFGDYHMDKEVKEDNGTAAYEKVLRDYEKKLMAEKRKRERERRKLRKKNLYAGFKPTTPQRKPRKGRHFPLDYGWSVEFF